MSEAEFKGVLMVNCYVLLSSNTERVKTEPLELLTRCLMCMFVYLQTGVSGSCG